MAKPASTVALSTIFAEELVRIDSWLIPRVHGQPWDIRTRQDTVAACLDQLGERSAAAQNLDRPITTADKLRKSDDQHVYLFIDRKANDGRGAILGFLRTGRKSLYFQMNDGKVTHVTPECVLDFYVVEDYQRRGIGHSLFRFMLKDKAMEPHQLAVDKPSPKLVAFLEKHFAVKDMTLHSNNYATAPSFFRSATAKSMTSNEPNAPAGRYSAQRPASEIFGIIHGGGL